MKSASGLFSAFRPIKSTLLLGVSFATAALTPAYGQEPADTDALRQETIIVTATKREAPLQDVPISITAFDPLKIEQLRPDSLSDLTTHVPNMYLPPANESATQYITMRGLGGGVTRSSGRSVGVYIDGAYASSDNLTNLPITDLAAIEVLKGPQGTLFGRDTIGGAINVTTRKPDNEIGGFAEFEFGNYERMVLTAGVDIPLVEDTLFLRVSGKKLNYGGHIDNAFNGDKADGLDQFSGRAQLYYTPNPQFDARLVYTHAERDDNPTTGENAGGTFADQIPYQVNINVQESFIQDADSLSLQMNYELASGHTLTSITGWSSSSDRSLVDRDLTPASISTQSILYDVEDISQEFRLTSPNSDKFDYLLGVYYLQSDVVNRDTYPLFGAAWLANVGFPPILPDVLDGQERAFTSESLAVFANANYHFTDKFSVFGGLRYTSDKKDVSHTTFGEVFGAFGFISANLVGETEDDPVTWSVGARYAFSDAVKTYASVSTGYRSSSIKDDFLTAADLLNPAGNLTDPEFVTNYEVGAKIRTDDGRFVANLAAFYMDYTDIQVSIAVPPLLFVRQLQNAAAAHIQGFEADASIGLTGNLRLSGSAGYLKTEYDEFKPDPLTNLSGTGFGTSPEWTADAALDYTRGLGGGGELLVHVDGTVVTTPDDFAPNRSQLELKGFSTLNAFAAYETSNQEWRVTLWAKNILDRSATTSTTIWGAGLGANQHSVYIYQPPRSYGITVKRNF